MKKIKIYISFLIIFITLFSFGCSKKIKNSEKWDIKEKYKEPYKEEKIHKNELDHTIKGIITLLSGIVKVNRGSKWEPVDVEENINQEDLLQTYNDSFCEIEFSDFCIVRLQENTKISLKDIYLKSKANKVIINMDNGNLLCKVKKLARGESFQVKTGTVLCGVRGTEFLIKSTSKKETVVAVKTGKVEVVPIKVAEKIEKIKKEVKSNIAKEVVEQIEIPKVIVTEKQEVILNKEEIKTVEKKI